MAGKPRLLIVEDDLDVAEMLSAYFRVQGYELQVVHWGEEAIEACNKQLPNLIILDIRLPDIDGFEVAQQLRRSRLTSHIPIIFLTEKRERADRLHGLELGADDYITKPFDIQELRLRVRNALRRADQPPLLNPVTNLPEGPLVDEQIEATLKRPDWAILTIRLAGLEVFRETYGFIASDDALRAISLMILNTVREQGEESQSVGQLNDFDFLILTQTETLEIYHRKLDRLLNHSLSYFYPLQDRSDPAQPPADGSLDIQFVILRASDGDFQDAAGIRAAIRNRLLE